MPVFAINKTLAAIQSLSQSGTQENADMVAGLIGVTLSDGLSDNPNDPNYRYKDTGYIANSRKELAANTIYKARDNGQLLFASEIDWDAIELNPRTAKTIITKSNLFGKVDWDTLKESGMSPAAGFLIDRVYASIAPEPSKEGPLGRKDYAIALESLRTRMEVCTTPEQVTDVLKEIKDELNGVQLNPEQSVEYDRLYQEARAFAKFAKDETEKLKAKAKVWRDLESEQHSIRWEQEKRTNRGWKTEPEKMARIKELEPLIAQAEKEYRDYLSLHPELESKNQDMGNGRVMHSSDLELQSRLAFDKVYAFNDRVKAKNLFESQATRSWLTLGDRFFSLLHYRNYKGSDAFANHVTSAKNGKITDWSWSDKERVVVKKSTKSEVSFQLKVAERLERVGGKAVSIASTSDLKQQFGFNEVQSGNWVLKDPNSARFHVEQTAAAMLDLGDVLGISPSLLGLGGRLNMAFGARGHGSAGWKESAARATYESVHRVINLTKMGGGGCLGHEWFHAIDDMLSELVTQQVVEKAQNYATEDASVLPEGKVKSAMMELSKVINTGTTQLFEVFAITDKDRATAKHNIDRTYLSGVAKVIKEAGSLNAAVKAVYARFGDTTSTKQIKNKKEWAKLAAAYYAPEGKDKVSTRTGAYVSSFVAEAVRLDSGVNGKYWSKKLELSARAFQSYLEDKLAEGGRKNDYLSVYADNKYHIDPLFGQLNPYPEGDERTRINAAFDAVFAAIREEQVLEKAVSNKPLMDSMFPLFDDMSTMTDTTISSALNALVDFSDYAKQGNVSPEVLSRKAGMLAGFIGVKIATEENDKRITPDIAGNMKSGDIVTTTDGKEYITIGARHDWLEVAPIINGKSQVNAESAFKFLLSPEKAGAYPERKNEPVYRTGRNYYDEQTTKGKNNVPNTQSGMERNSQAANGQPVGATGVSSTGGGDGRGTGSDNGGTGSQGRTVGSTNDLFNGSATTSGAGSDSQVYASEPSISGSIAERGGRGRGGNGRVNGKGTERTTASAVSSTTTTTALIRQKIKEQADVEHIPVAKGDIDNIRHTLPFLQDVQQDDVFKAEQRFEQGHGMLFTNGTGTGKTYSGLGVVKRFHKQGKDNIIIVAPSQDIMKDWIKSGANLGLAITALESTTEAGEGIVITTYANLAANQHLADRNWDLVVADECHKLMTNEAGEPTAALNAFRAITNHPSGLNTRARMSLRDLQDEINGLEATIKDNRTSDNENQWFANNALEAKLKGLYREFDAKQKALVEQYKGQPRTKAVMLSATPFAYVKNVDYAEGYLFEYGDDRGDGYNSGNGREKFFMSNFGYRMRYNRLTQPDANVNSEVMERNFNDYLKKSGALSGRRLNIDQDYERSFALVDDAIGEKIDEGLEWLRTANDGRYSPVYDSIMKKFDYLSRLRLLEALKASHAVKTIKQCLALGRKIVVFHDYNEGGNLSNPFKNISFEQEEYTTKGGENVSGKVLLEEAKDLRPDIFNLDIEGIASPINTIKANFPTALIYNGTVSNKDRTEAKRLFNDDNSGNDIIVVQSAAGEAGISLHDTTGQKQRILLNLGMPTRPTTAIQQEGRIYRVGQKTDAIFKYMNTGTTWERQTFATKISERASTVENLALGEEARALKQAFIDAYQNSDYYEPSEGEGKGGKEADKAENTSISPFERAITFYYAQQKNSKSRANREGKDYYATPEPVGFKMVEFGGVRSGDKLLEPSAGHGAIARFFPEQNARTLVEQSPDLASRATLASTGSKVITGSFESLHITNKYDVIVMNPPYGSGGKTAIEHVTKAVTHLRNGGRIVALIPEGQANKRLADMLSSEAGKDLYQVADIHLPSSTFERAGTGVMTHIVVLEKQTDKEVAEKIRGRNIDISNAENVKELFSRLENISLPARLEPLTKEVEPLLKGEKVTVGGINFQVEDDNSRMVSLDGRIEKSQFSYLARLAPKFGGMLDTEYRKTLFSFASAQHLTAFLDAIEKGEEAAPISSAKVETSGIDILKAGEFTHSKKGTPVYAASITARVDKDVYNSLKEKAGEFDGYYSSFNKMGAIAGFHFPTKDKRDAFISAVQGAKGEAGFDSLNGGVSLMDTLALITSLSKKKSEAVAQQLAVAIGVQIEKPLQPIKNSAGEVSTSNGLELKIAIPDKLKSAGIKSLSNIRFMIDPVVGEALTANTNVGQPVKIQLSDKPELKALWENYSAIKSNNDAQAQEAIQTKKEADLALDQVEIDKMNQQAKELMAKIPEGCIPVDFVSNTEYSVHGISLSWHDVVVVGHASAIRKGALGSFEDVTVAYITPEKLAEVKARKDKIRDQLIAEKKDLLTAVVPKSAMDLYKKYRGSAENAWSAGDDGAWAAINAWSPYIEAQASDVRIEKPSPTDFTLSTYTEAELRAQEATLKEAEAKRQADEKAAKEKAIADKQVGDFRLSGSSLPSDVAASYGQGDMFVQTRGQQVEKPVTDNTKDLPNKIKKYKSGSREWQNFCRDSSTKYAKLYQSYMNDKTDYDGFIKNKEKSPLSDDALKNIERIVGRSFYKWREIDIAQYDLKPEYLEVKEKPQYDDMVGFTFTPAIALNDTLNAIMALAKNNSQANAERLSQLLGVKLAPKQEVDMFGDPIQHQELDMFGDPIQTESPIQELPRLAIEELPLGNITLSDDVPQFKSGADDDTGVVEPLGGKFDRTGVAPIQVWRRLDGRLEVISGRHRLDLANRSGEKTIPAQVHDEADGFDAKKAGMLDAELNIRDGQGKVRDYVDYFTHSGVTKEQADERGLLARSIGQRAFAIASQGSEELLTLHRNEMISDQAAADIATLAPNNSAMQAVGLRVLQENKPLNNALNTMRAVIALTREKGQEPDTFDLFGFDDSALKEAEAMAKIASRKQRQIGEQLSAIKGAVKNPKAAAKHGVIVENQADALAKVQTMTVLKSRWDNWSSHADLLAEVRQEIAEKGGYDSILSDDYDDGLQSEYDSLAMPSMTDYDVQDVDTVEIKLNPIAYQWRSNVTGDGTEKGRVVSGTFNYDDQPPLILHRRLSGRIYLADGHHRYKMAKASHAPIVKAIVLDEHDGYTVPAMRVLCGFLNLRKEALVKDHVKLPMVNMAKTADLVRKAVEAEMGW